MPEADRIEGFRALTASDRSGSYYMEDADGEHRLWDEMSAVGKLRQIASNAAYYDVPFMPFAEMVHDALGSAGMTPLEVAALRVVWRDERELYELACLIPDDGRTESGPSPVEFFREVMAERDKAFSPGKESLSSLLQGSQQDQTRQPGSERNELER
jgi:hypothetical protein